ncbi:hypothetical protein Scep_012426 [Stephania cephalantha]|uniref:Uncharacterized protein n=1 Tax=Stephania cephalantha TaxID=152367 RepID=A0AAP0JF50_9MAGN
MELPRSLLRSPLPSAPSAAPQEGRGGTPHIDRFPITIESVGKNCWVLHPSEVCARRMTKIFKRGMITEGYCWKSVPYHQKEIYWERWKSYFQWDPSIDEAIVRAAYDAKACVRYGALMHELRTFGVRLDFVTDEAWNRYPLDKDEDDEVTPNDVFLHVHTKDHDGVTFIDSISAQLSCDAREEAKTRRYANLGASTFQEPMVRRSEFDAVVQRLAQFEAFVQSHLGMRMDFSANVSQAPPPPPPQEHHQQVRMDSACSPQKKHDDDDRDNPDWVDEEHLGDEKGDGLEMHDGNNGGVLAAVMAADFKGDPLEDHNELIELVKTWVTYFICSVDNNCG